MKTLMMLAVLTVFLTVTAFSEGEIDISYAGYTISQPGSYIVVDDLHAATDQNAITIETSNVSIDLNGHTLYGAGTTVGTSGNGIYDTTVGGANNISIINGTIRDFRESGIYLTGTNERVQKVNTIANKNIGIFSNGAVLSGGGVISECNSAFNGSHGIACLDGVIRNNVAANNGGYGIDVYENSVVTDNSVIRNGTGGIYCSACTLAHNQVAYNLVDGIIAYVSLVENNNVYSNNHDGIKCYKGRIIHNYVQGNGNNIFGYGAGIDASSDNTIEENTLLSNDTGLLTTSTANFITGNQLHLNTVSIFTSSGNLLGDGTTGFFNKVYYAQPNYLIQQFAGFEIPVLRESPESVIRNLEW